jgi:pimeloyl-ACP methyl ester carboxylesterase
MNTSLSTNPKINKLYKDVSPDALERLQSFRRRYPYEAMILQGREWRYIDTREGQSALFIPAGGTTIAEVSFLSLEHFAQQRRVVSPDYPPVNTIKEFFDGSIELIERLGIEQFTAMGGSYGGWIVQSLVRMYPQRVRKLVITAVGPPNPENSRQLSKMMHWLRLMPVAVLRALMNRAFARLDSNRSADPNLVLLWALVKEVMYNRVEREDILAALLRLIDQTENYTFSPEDLKDWPGQILMLFGAEDPATPPDRRTAMRELYPQAEMKVFEGGEHGIALSHQEQYFAAIDEFLAG